MKLAALALLIPLSGCLTAQEEANNAAIRAQIEEAQYQQRIQERCRSYGFRDNTAEFRNCLMQVDTANRQADRATRDMLLQQYMRR